MVAQVGKRVVFFVIQRRGTEVVVILLAAVELRVVQVAYGKLFVLIFVVVEADLVFVFLVVAVAIGRRGLGFDLDRHQTRLQLARQIADFVLAASAGSRVIGVAQPDAQLQQRGGNMPAQTQRQRHGQGQQNQAEQAHALQADGHRLLELLGVEADAQVPGDHFLKGDRRRVQPFGFAQQTLFGARAGFGEDAVIDAVDGGMGHQRIFF